MQQQSFSTFQCMSSDALKHLLKADSKQLDTNENLDAVLYITSILEERARALNEPVADPEEMLRHFRSILSCTDQRAHNLPTDTV